MSNNRFCKECSNMLYPEENPQTKKLRFRCIVCNYSEECEENTSENNLVYRNEIKLAEKNFTINPGIINDPTYSRTHKITCNKCGFHEAIFFQNPNINDPGMKLIFVCCNKNCKIEPSTSTNSSYENYCGNWWYGS